MVLCAHIFFVVDDTRALAHFIRKNWRWGMGIGQHAGQLFSFVSSIADTKVFALFTRACINIELGVYGGLERPGLITSGCYG